MPTSLAFYNDPGISSLATKLSVVQASDGSSTAADRVLYLGSPVVGKKFQVASNPGVTDISLSITDAAVSTGIATSAVKLSLSAAGLDAAADGAALTVGTQILSGAGNAVAIYIRVKTPAIAAGTYTDLSAITQDLVEIGV